MNKSESIAKLSEALSKAQATMAGAKMDSDNPFFKSKYADLSSVWDACRKPLTDNGLAVIQTAAFIPEHPELVAIETTLTHSSGEYTTGILAAKPVKNDPQAIGSCVTYLRRYSLAAICGISPEDDDGNAATGQTTKPTLKPTTTVKQKDDIPNFKDTEKPQEQKNRERLEILITESKENRERIKEYLLALGWLPIPKGEEKLSMTQLADARVKQIVDKWESFLKTFRVWDKQIA